MASVLLLAGGYKVGVQQVGVAGQVQAEGVEDSGPYRGQLAGVAAQRRHGADAAAVGVRVEGDPLAVGRPGGVGVGAPGTRRHVELVGTGGGADPNVILARFVGDVGDQVAGRAPSRLLAD